MLRIALVDDHPLLRSGLKALIEPHPDLRVVLELENARRASLAAAKADVDLFIVDVRLPDRDGISLVHDLHRAGHRSLILTVFDDPEHASRALQAGASGYAIKSDPPGQILQAIRTVGAGGTYLAPSLAAHFGGHQTAASNVGLASLSRREREVFDLVVRGLSGREIAQALYISHKTVESHRYKINRKLGVRSVAQLVRFAALNGLSLG
jgi:two-component system uhpT operon response regulator UhpA